MTDRGLKAFRSLPMFALFLALILVSGCGSPPTDVRTVLPGDALIYLESKDLEKAAGSVVNSPAIRPKLGKVPDVSLLEGMEIAIAVTGFETSEQAINEENSVLNFQPRFVAAIETRLWNFQVISFVEENLGLFISEVYGGEAVLETSEKHGGNYFVWSGQDGRKAYGLVVGSLILFGNDESAIERSVAIRSGQGESIAAAGKATNTDALAAGYITEQGIGQIANIVGISMAKGAGDEPEVQSIIARILPELLRNSTREIRWTSKASEAGVEDVFDIALAPDIAQIFAETLAVSGSEPDPDVVKALPAPAISITRYDLKDPQVAWRSILLAAPKISEQASGPLIPALAGSLFEQYGVDAPESFLGGVGPHLFTVKLDEQGERTVVVAAIKDEPKLRTALAKELGMSKAGEALGSGQTWITPEKDLRAVIDRGRLILGDPAAVLEFHTRLSAGQEGSDRPAKFGQFAASKATAVTFSNDTSLIGRVALVLSSEKPQPSEYRSFSLTTSKITNKGIERTVVSDLGLIGSIIAMLSGDDK